MKRNNSESFEDYRKRRDNEQKETRKHIRGEVFWNSRKDGTYYKPKDK